MKKSLVCALIVFVLITAISVCSVFAAGVFSKEESIPCLACGENMKLCCGEQAVNGDESLSWNAYYCESCGYFERSFDSHDETSCKLIKLHDAAHIEDTTALSDIPHEPVAAGDYCEQHQVFECETLTKAENA